MQIVQTELKYSLTGRRLESNMQLIEKFSKALW